MAIIGQGLLSTIPQRSLSLSVQLPTDDNDWIYDEGQRVSASLRLVTDRETVIQTSQVDAGGDWTFNGVGLGAEASYVSSVTTSQYSVDMMFSIYVSTGFKQLKERKLIPDAIGLLDKPAKFAQIYGDMYYVEQEYGGVLIFAGSYFSGSEVLTRETRDSITANTVRWGFWAEVSQRLQTMHELGKLDFYLYYEGPEFDLPDTKALSDPPTLIKSINDWITNKALMNTPKSQNAIPIRHYFDPYSSVTGLPDNIKPPLADYDGFRKLQRLAERGRDRANAISQIRGSLDSFEFIEPKNLNSLSDETAKFNVACYDAIEYAKAHPLDTVIVPDNFPTTDLPGLNPYSIEAIFDRLGRGKKITITVERPVRLTTYFPPVAVIRAEKEYEISYDSRTNTWYGYPGDSDELQPDDGRTTRDLIKGQLWLWAEPFQYDNRGCLNHQATKGQIVRVEV